MNTGVTVRIDWEGNTRSWDETCIWAIEAFGLPGDKFTTSPSPNHMDFYFINQQDATAFVLSCGGYVLVDQ